MGKYTLILKCTGVYCKTSRANIFVTGGKRVNVLLQSGVDLTDSDDSNYKVLEYAVEGNSAECVNLLLEAGAGVNSESLALHLVVKNNTPESFKMLEMFVNAGLDISNTPVPLLPRAAGSDALEHMQLLLNSGADVNAVDNLGQSALIIACALERTAPSEWTEEIKASWHKRKYKCIELLLDQGADVNMKDNSQGATALVHVANRGLSQDFAELLIKAGADVNSRRPDGSTALICAVQRRWEKDKLVELLIKSGADVNLQNNNGATAVMLATTNGDDKCLELLLDAGADVNISAHDGRTALFYMVLAHQSYKRCLKLLFSAAAVVNRVNNDAKNSLEYYLLMRSTNTETMKILFAAGESVTDTTTKQLETMQTNLPDFLVHAGEKKHELKHMCREAVRRHLLSLSPENLFVRIPRLSAFLNTKLIEYSLYTVML